jgi:AcrR family transcriptional regulator
VPEKSQAARGRAEESGRAAIMDAAERLFAERGIDAVSLRTINAEAGYSVAALHYHFATRDGLVRALLERAQPPMFAERERMIAQLSSQAQPTVEGIVAALVVPLTAGMAEEFEASVAKLRFLVRLSFDRSPYLRRTVEDSFALFRPLLRRALPQLEERTLMRRWRFAADLAQQALANALEDHLAGGGARGARFTQFLEDLMAFISGGLRAGVAPAHGPEPGSPASSRSAAV